MHLLVDKKQQPIEALIDFHPNTLESSKETEHEYVNKNDTTQHKNTNIQHKHK